MQRLIDGYRRFRTDRWPAEQARYQALARSGQRPETLVIACPDSRVNPQTVFGAGPGELFVIRNVTGLVPPYEPDANPHGTSAALEFAVRILHVRRIAVLGHADCGGIAAILYGTPQAGRDFLAPWTALARPALDCVAVDLPDAERMRRCEAEVVGLTLRNLLTFPWIADAVATGTLGLHGFRFAVATGTLERFADGAFVPID